MATELDVFGKIAEIELAETAAIVVEQVKDEITIVIASVVCSHFRVTADQAMELSRALAAAAENVQKFLASEDIFPIDRVDDRND
jgi:hypothetical protein